MNWETVWEFKTARFAVTLAVTDETDDPADSFECDEDIAFAREGGWHWFAARVQVTFRDSDNPKHWAVTPEVVLGRDYLGGCSYRSLSDFIAPGPGYFRDMVREAIGEARGTLARMTADV
jgi:hypothetical protein